MGQDTCTVRDIINRMRTNARFVDDGARPDAMRTEIICMIGQLDAPPAERDRLRRHWRTGVMFRATGRSRVHDVERDIADMFGAAA